jgi:hypothetical protein
MKPGAGFLPPVFLRFRKLSGGALPPCAGTRSLNTPAWTLRIASWSVENPAAGAPRVPVKDPEWGSVGISDGRSTWCMRETRMESPFEMLMKRTRAAMNAVRSYADA